MMVIAHIIYCFFELEKPQRPISLENSCKMADAGACLALFLRFLGNNPPGFPYKSGTHCWVCSSSTPKLLGGWRNVDR